MDYALKSTLIEFKWGAVMAGVITADQALVFGLIKGRGRCGLAELKQISGLSPIRFNKALELLLVVEKVVIHNDEVIFVPVKPSLAAISPVVAVAPSQEPEPAAPVSEPEKPRPARVSKRCPADVQEVVNYINGLDRNKYSHLFTNPLVDIEGTAEEFFNFYASKGWVVGDSPMKDWTKALLRAISAGKNGGARSNNGWAIRYHNINQVAATLDAAYDESKAQSVGFVEPAAAPAISYASQGPVIDVPYESVEPAGFNHAASDPVRSHKIEQKVIAQIGLPPSMASFAQIPNAPTAEETYNFDNALRDYYERKAKAMAQAVDAYASVPTEEI